MIEAIALSIDSSSPGPRVNEEVLVEVVTSGRYRLVKSPGFVLGLAAGDIFEVLDGGAPHVLKRGGNICIQMFCAKADADVIAPYATRKIVAIRGWLDGKIEKELVFSVPVSSGFDAIETCMNNITSEFVGSEWHYGNVYAGDGITPLEWWKAEP